MLALVMVLSDDAPAAVVMFPSAAFLETLPGDVAITGQTAISVTLYSDAPNLAAALYAAGAPLVLPSGLKGCAPLTS
ncbi:MAG: hypothetical protein AAF744_14165 [Pseudomonadota bacterium]